MPDFYVVTVDGETPKEEKLTLDETVIGRKFLSFICTDQRISRSHGLLIQKPDTTTSITLKCTHTNPLFYKIANSNEVQILNQNIEVNLNHDDQFGLLADNFWYRIEIRNGENGGGNSGLRVRSLNELNSVTSAAAAAVAVTSNSNIPVGPRIKPQIVGSQDIDSTEPPPPKRICVERVEPESSATSSTVEPEPELAAVEPEPSSAVVEPSNIEPLAAIVEPELPENEPEPAPSSPIGEHGEATPAPIRTPPPLSPPLPLPISTEVPPPVDHSSPGPSNPASTTATAGAVAATTIKKEIKTEEADSSVYRDSCSFGIRCYRRNLEHRREEAHPGDTDYRRPNFPPAPPDAPACPYGASCYRRNPQHFIEFSHPDSTQITTRQVNNPLPPPPSSTASIRARVNRNTHDDEDDDEEEDIEEEEDEEEEDAFAASDSDADFVVGNESTTDDELDDGEVNEE